MRRASALAVLLLGLTLPACAQRGAAHGGFSGHAASGFHGGSFQGGYSGFRGPARSGFGSAPRFASRPGLPARFAANRFRGAYPQYSARPVFYARSRGAYAPARAGTSLYAGRGTYADRNRRDRYGYPGYAYPGYIGYGFAYPFIDSFWDDPFDPFWDYADTSAYDTAGYDTAYAPPDAEAPYAPQWAPQDNSAAVAPWPQPPQPFAAAPSAPPDEEDAVTIIFKDGRPPEQIRNYALTRSTLYLPGRHMREIPLDEIDLPATEKVNRDAGVDFRPPESK